MNEETIIEKCPEINGQPESKQEGVEWKHVTLGGVSGILMGAGMMYAGQVSAQEPTKEEAPNEDNPKVVAPEPGETSHTLENGLQVAAVNDDLSFGEAFARARAEVGPGGVFHWHGGIYNTYTVEEWNAMSLEQKHHFAQQVQPEIHPNELSTPTDANPQVVVVHHVYHHETAPEAPEVHQAATPATDDVQMVEQKIAHNFDMGDDVHIVGYTHADGHLVVGYDTTGDNQVDVAIIDVDDNLKPSDDDVIVDTQGHRATLGELNNEPNPSQTALMDNPDVAPDMPDYMNDANIDYVNEVS